MEKPEYFTCINCHKEIIKMNEIIHKLTCKKTKAKKIKNKNLEWLENKKNFEFRNYPEISKTNKKEKNFFGTKNENLIKC